MQTHRAREAPVRRQAVCLAWPLSLECASMHAKQLLFITGKGGAGKTTVAAALGQYAAQAGTRTLIVETASDGRLAHLFGHRALKASPTSLQTDLDAVRVEARELVERYFSRLLRFSILSKRLFTSPTFNALTAAAPGITEFLLLQELLGWIEPGFARRRTYHLIIVDGPATGHALKLLRTPRTLATMVPGGPLGKTARTLLSLLADHQRTQVLLVSLPEEMAVRETIEAHEVLEGDLALHVARPIINRVLPRHFSAGDAAAIERSSGPAAPLVAAAQFSIAWRREAERHVASLRRALGVSPVLLRQLFTAEVHAADLVPFGRTLGRVVLTPGF
jgi:anion-transporting  ArsA/GET3 family ATPase